MTMTIDQVRWHAPQAGVWVGRVDGRFVGLVEARWGTGFTATTRLGKQLGLFPTVDDAQRALEREHSNSHALAGR
jgi:hypothetical protein